MAPLPPSPLPRKEGGNHEPPSSALLGAIAWGDFFILCVFFGRLLDHRTQQLLIRGQPVADKGPLLAVPLLNPHLGSALMVEAGQLERRDQTFEANLLDPLLIKIQILEAPTDLFAGQGLFAELSLRGPDPLDDKRPVDQAAVVQHLPNLFALRRAFAPVVK